MNALSFLARRRAAAWLQAVLVIGLPFLRISGESALRFDIPSLKLYFWGSVIWISEAYFFLLIFLLFFVGVMLFTVLYGRIWCGWVCPQTVLSHVTKFIARTRAHFSLHRVRRLVISHILLLLASLFISANLIWYFVSPYEMFPNVIHGSLGPWITGSWVLFLALIYLDLAFVRQRFCRSVCPYSRLQSAFFDDRTLTIRFDKQREDECSRCEACVRTCPSGMDIRDGLQVECINCAECIDACSGQMSIEGKDPLIGYSRGVLNEDVRKGPRARIIGLSLLFAIIAVMFTYQIYARMPVDFWVFREEDKLYEQAGLTGGINTYTVTIENRSLASGTYLLSISGIKDAELVAPQNPVLVPPNSALKMTVYVFAKRKDLVYRVTQLRFAIENMSSHEIKIMQEAPFIYPERTDKGVEI